MIADRGNDNWLIKYDGGEVIETPNADPTEVSNSLLSYCSSL